MSECCSNFFRSIDIYAQPVSNQLTMNKRKRLGTCYGGLCSVLFGLIVVYLIYIFSILVRGNEDMIEQNSYTKLTELGDDDKEKVDLENIIIAYSQSTWDVTWMNSYFI